MPRSGRGYGMSEPDDRFRTAEFRAWEVENERHCRNAFGISARDFARRWWAGDYGDVAELEASGNWQDELIVRLGRALDAHRADETGPTRRW